jgi:hypothetical protein
MLAHVQDGSLSVTVIQQQVDNILRSAEFSGSEVLRNLLSFLTTHSLEHPGEQVKEYELAIAVLGKAEGFDPRLDSAVRVHASRLRSKLAEYYMSDGAEDPLLIEVPKGSYQVVWRYRNGEPHAATPTPRELPAAPAAPTIDRRKWFAAGFGAAAALTAIALMIWMPHGTAGIASIVQGFWQPFLRSDHVP